jgi:1,4-dihydroxy-2-naphthoate octaprenyltransferase
MTEISNTVSSSAPSFNIKVWIKTARPFTLSATATPLLVGTALAAYHGIFNGWIFFMAFIAGLFLQVGANFFNEFFDFKYGLDSTASLGASTVIFRNEMTANQVLLGGIGSFAIASLLGIGLLILIGPAIILFGLIGMAIAYFYSARPFKFATRGLGDILVFLAMGILMTYGAYYVQIPHWSWAVGAASVPIGLLVVAILDMNNIRDYEEDLAVAKKTIVVRFGRPVAKNYHAILVLGAYLITSLGVLLHLLPLLSLAVWLTFPTAYTHLRTIMPATERKNYITGMKQIAALHLQFGVALALGIMLATLLHMSF